MAARFSCTTQQNGRLVSTLLNECAWHVESPGRLNAGQRWHWPLVSPVQWQRSWLSGEGNTDCSYKSGLGCNGSQGNRTGGLPAHMNHQRQRCAMDQLWHGLSASDARLERSRTASTISNSSPVWYGFKSACRCPASPACAACAPGICRGCAVEGGAASCDAASPPPARCG